MGGVVDTAQTVAAVLGGLLLLVGPAITAYVGIVRSQASYRAEEVAQYKNLLKELSRIEGKIDTINGTVRRHERDISVMKHREKQIESELDHIKGILE